MNLFQHWFNLKRYLSRRSHLSGHNLGADERYQSVFENAGIAMVIIGEDKIILLANSKFEQLSGYFKKEMEGKMSWMDFIASQDRELMIIQHRLIRKDPESALRSYEFSFKNKSGNIKDILLNINLITGTKNSVASLDDITERMHAQKKLELAYNELKEAQAKLIQSAKMAAVGQLASGVAHEINNPLTGVLNNVQLVKLIAAQKQAFNIEDFRDILNVIEESAIRCRDITRSLLDFSQASKGITQVICLNEAIDKVSDLIRHEMRLENVIIQKEFQENLPDVKGDLQLLEQVIFNLVSNAKWAIEKKSAKLGGTIIIKTEYASLADQVCLSVSDNGIGIPREILAKIYEPFFTTKPVGEGTGLGLSMVYNIVKQHHGDISIESREGEGSTFKICLPRFTRVE